MQEEIKLPRACTTYLVQLVQLGLDLSKTCTTVFSQSLLMVSCPLLALLHIWCATGLCSWTSLVYLFALFSQPVKCDFFHNCDYHKYTDDTELSKSTPPDQFSTGQSICLELAFGHSQICPNITSVQIKSHLKNLLFAQAYQQKLVLFLVKGGLSGDDWACRHVDIRGGTACENQQEKGGSESDLCWRIVL